MSHWYEIWDTESRNLVADFDTEMEALEFVLDSLGSFGPESLETLILTRESEEEAPDVVASAHDLAELAWRHRPQLQGIDVSTLTSRLQLEHIVSCPAEISAGIALRVDRVFLNAVRVGHIPDELTLAGAC